MIALRTFIILLPLFINYSNYDDNSYRYFFYENYFIDLETLEKVKENNSLNPFSENNKYIFVYTKNTEDTENTGIFNEVIIYSKETSEKINSFEINSRWTPITRDKYIIGLDNENFYIYDFDGNKLLSCIRRYIIDEKALRYLNSEIAIYKDKIFLTMPNNALKMIDIQSGNETILANEEENIERNINGSNLLFTLNDGVIHLKNLESKEGYIIYKYDEIAQILYKSQIAHTYIEIKGNVHHHHRYLYYFTHTQNHLIFTTVVFERGYNKSVIVDLKTGKSTEADLIVSGIVKDDNGELKGLLSIDEDNNTLSLYSENGKEKKWVYNFPNNIYSDMISSLLYDNILVIVHYSQISTGSNLLALDIKTGELLWNAEVEQLNVGHSKYHNRIILNRYENKVIMLGLESFGGYLQIFDIDTGRRLFSEINKTSW